MSEFRSFINSNQSRFLAELFHFLRIPSVSADSTYKGDVRKAAQFLVDRFKELGVSEVQLFETSGHPIVFAHRKVDPSLPTVLVYGHYDVQPADPIDLWKTPPFEPQIRDERIYARGACDDKGQVYMHLKAMEVLDKTLGLPCNIKFVIEGEEEVGSDNLDTFVKEHLELLKADTVLISDTSMISLEHPSLTVGLRGLSYLEVEVTGPNRDLHSGVYGGAVANPINVLCEMIASLKDEHQHITIPEFYDDVVELSVDDRAQIQRIPFNEIDYKKHLDIDALYGEQGYSTLERVSIRPTLDVNGIWGGYTGEGAKTVIASKAYAKISMRLVPNQKPEKITALFESHFKKIAPASVKVKVTPHHGGDPVVTPTNSVAFKAAVEAFKTVWGKEPICTREGGSIPIVALFSNTLSIPVILLGFGLDEDAIHSPNESYGVRNFELGIETICSFHEHYAVLMKKY